MLNTGEPLFDSDSSTPIAVRSSAIGEDSAGHSFAGLHESIIGVRGKRAIEDAVRLVWASLWSDAALLYRQELGLDPARSRMAVVVQEMVDADRLRALNGQFANLLASEFTPKQFLEVRQLLVDQGLSRGYINYLTSLIIDCFRWGTEQNLVSANIPMALRLVMRLKRGKSKARELEPVSRAS